MPDLSLPATDADLLCAWRDRRDDTALAELCRRHGGLVRASCLRMRATDAEEAVQAVFVILSQKPGAIGDADRLAGWLLGTARRVVAHQRRARARRLRHEREAAMVQMAIAQADGTGEGGAGGVWEDARELLDEALSRLSPGRREALVRFYLQGQPQSEVAADLGCSVDAVKTRVHEGLVALRAFFSRRGVGLSIAALASGLAAEARAAETDLSVLDTPVESMPMPGAQELAGHVLAEGGWTSSLAAGVSPSWSAALCAVSGLALAGAVAVLVRPHEEAQMSAADRGEVIAADLVPPGGPSGAPATADPPSRVFAERFADGDFRSRGWYDNTGFRCSVRPHDAGRSVEFRFMAGEPLPRSGGPARLLFTPGDDVRIRYRIAYDTGWDPSTSMVQLLLLTTEDGRYAAPSGVAMSCGIGVMDGSSFVAYPEIADDAAPLAGGARPLRRYLIPSVPSAGPWHDIEVRFRMNGIAGGKAVADGRVSFRVDGRELLSRSDVIFRTSARSSMRFNQLILGPYASVSPGAQSMWMDDLEILVASDYEQDPPSPGTE